MTSARRFSGAFGSCSPSRPLTTVCQASMRGRSARSKYGCRRFPSAARYWGSGNSAQTPLVGVLHPQNAVLVLIKSGHQNPLEAGHQFFALPGRQVSLRKRQYPGGVFLRIRRGVDESPGPLPAVPAGRWRPRAAGLYRAGNPPVRR